MGETALTAAEQNYYFALSEYLEYGCVGAGIGSGIASTDRIPLTTPGAEPPRDARDSGSARSHSTHLETSSSVRP